MADVSNYNIDTATSLGQALLEQDIYPRLWKQAYDGDGDFVDFLLASAVATALGYPALGEFGPPPAFGSGGWTDAEFEEALSVAVERWPAPLSDDD